MRILFAHNQSMVVSNLIPFLERAGFNITTIHDGKSIFELILTLDFEILILDVQLPPPNGREILKRLRHDNNWLPIILIANEDNSSVEGAMALAEGADDYLIKPIDPLELVARIQVIERRTKYQFSQEAHNGIHQIKYLMCHDLCFDRLAWCVHLEENEISLTPKAMEVLEYLMLHDGEVIKREQLLSIIWNWAYCENTRTIDVRISELINALRNSKNIKYIDTVRGYGYRFTEKVQKVY